MQSPKDVADGSAGRRTTEAGAAAGMGAASRMVIETKSATPERRGGDARNTLGRFGQAGTAEQRAREQTGRLIGRGSEAAAELAGFLLRNGVPLAARTRHALPSLRGWLRTHVGPALLPHVDALRRAIDPGPAIGELRLAGAPPERPMVSVIVPVFNKLEYTLACLDSIARNPPAVSFEVVVVDDGSTDATREQLSARSDIRYLRNATNLGFVGSCNRGAAEARGELLHFLNNDTVVAPDWLDALVRTLTRVPDAGLVGSKLVYPDGRLQEAGGLIWSDASGCNWGKFGDPAEPRYNYARDVDYCSGASILVRKDVFDAVGGFDLRYAPAYYEDTDLAFTLRARGLRVLYQPMSEVTHFEGITAGRSTSSGVKAYQVRNRQVFLVKWRESLQAHEKPAGAPSLHDVDRSVRARMLIVDSCTPTPDQDSGSVDMVNTLRMLLDLGYRVTFVADSKLSPLGRYTRALQEMGVECACFPYVTSTSALLRARGADFDAVMLVRAPVAYRYLEQVRRNCPRAKLLFNTVDLHFLRAQRRAELLGGKAPGGALDEQKRRELAVVAAADATMVVSPVEKAILDESVPGARVRVLPVLREVPGRERGFAERSGVVFVGGFRHSPNVDAVLWFCREIWPRVRERLPHAEFSIIGSNMVPEVRALQGEGVRVLGFVEDVTPLFGRARLSVAPLRYGAGQKGKVVMSLSYGVPSVVTSVAAEGMGLQNGRDAWVADSPDAFAEGVAALHEDRKLWESMSDAGLELVTREFSVDANRPRLAALLAELGLPG